MHPSRCFYVLCCVCVSFLFQVASTAAPIARIVDGVPMGCIVAISMYDLLLIHFCILVFCCCEEVIVKFLVDFISLSTGKWLAG
uniref:Secreted protein n=1 Tax=Anopheles darlingi TaxID=43151 RepID=A0A2M4DJ21_ANODA